MQRSWILAEKFGADIELKANSYVVIKRTQFPTECSLGHVLSTKCKC